MYLQERGAEVNFHDDPERQSRREDLGLPEEAGSCHTGIVEGYVIEGHVPFEAIEALLAERPDIIGLALPGMPADSPGMGGDEVTWSNQRVVAVERSGALTEFGY